MSWRTATLNIDVEVATAKIRQDNKQGRLYHVGCALGIYNKGLANDFDK